MIVPVAERLNRVGEYFFSRKLREVAELGQSGPEIINFGIGSPDLPPSPEAITALVQAAPTPNHHGYQPYHGTPALRQAMAKWHKQTYGVDLDPATQVLPLMGSKEGIFHASLAFLNPGDAVLVPDPGYPSYASVTRLVGAEAIPYDLTEENNWLPDFAALAERDLSQVKLIWVNYPHMPTGAMTTLTALRQVVDFALEHEILICYDNPYSLVLNQEPPFSILQVERAFECAVEFNSLSKSHHMAGWRVGMALGQEDHIKSILAIKSNMDSGMFLPVQKAAIAALRNAWSWHDEQNRIYAERRKKVCELMDLLGCTYTRDTPGLFVWGRTPESVADIEKFLDELLYGARVFLTPGIIFGRNGERYIRASLCLSVEQIEIAIERIRTHLKD